MQLRELTRGLTVSSARTELVVMLYSRLCDYRDFWKVLYVLEAWEQASVMRRLGARTSGLATPSYRRRALVKTRESSLFKNNWFIFCPSYRTLGPRVLQIVACLKPAGSWAPHCLGYI